MKNSITFSGRVIYSYSTKASYSGYNTTYMIEDADGNIYLWTTNVSSGPADNKLAIGQRVNLTGILKEQPVALTSHRALITVTKCKKEKP